MPLPTLIIVSGPSGTGKTTLARAGVRATAQLSRRDFDIRPPIEAVGMLGDKVGISLDIRAIRRN